MPSNLVIVRAGDASLHTAWLEGGRTWDIIVSYYGDNPDLYRDLGQRRIDAKGPKWPALHQLVRETFDTIATYDCVWFPDDDLVSDATAINRLFEICHEFSLDLAQPSLTLDSIAGHIITLSNRSFRLRFTNFVEIMAPCFSREFLRRCWPSFNANNSGWGLDYLWPTWAAPGKVAIIDEIAVRHTRARGELYNVLKGQGKTPEREMAELLVKENIKPVDIIMGGVMRDGQQLMMPQDRAKLIELIKTGYLPALANYPQHIAKVIEPMLRAFSGKNDGGA